MLLRNYLYSAFEFVLTPYRIVLHNYELFETV